MVNRNNSFDILVSAPHLDGAERRFLDEALASNWIAPLGPQVEAFEHEFAEAVNMPAALALSSGTAGLHLALLLHGVGPGDEVLVSTLTFVASANPVRYLGANPTFVDSERRSWNIDPDLVEGTLRARLATNRRPKAVVAVDLYGQTANLGRLEAICADFGVPLIEDAAEALGATHGGRAAGSFGSAGVFSFNGNKIITTSGGGMLVSHDRGLVAKARKLATQAREPAPHYEHTEVGFNYRLSNLLAAVGRGQLGVLERRVAARQRNYQQYVAGLAGVDGLDFMPEAGWGRHTRWLTTVTIDPERFGADREQVRLALAKQRIEARPLWKPMHLQPVFAGAASVGGSVAAELFDTGLCLPSGSNLRPEEIRRVIDVILSCRVR